MSELGVLSHGMTAVGWLVLFLLLLTSWRGRLRGGLLVVAVLIRACRQLEDPQNR